MYWGIVDEIFKTNKFQEICLKEINDCKSTSIGPFFLVIFMIKMNYSLFLYDFSLYWAINMELVFCQLQFLKTSLI
jgi:hypothetical protein